MLTEKANQIILRQKQFDFLILVSTLLKNFSYNYEPSFQKPYKNVRVSVGKLFRLDPPSLFVLWVLHLRQIT